MSPKWFARQRRLNGFQDVNRGAAGEWSIREVFDLQRSGSTLGEGILYAAKILFRAHMTHESSRMSCKNIAPSATLRPGIAPRIHSGGVSLFPGTTLLGSPTPRKSSGTSCGNSAPSPA